MTTESIPLVDLKAQYAAIRPAVDRAVQSVLDSTNFIMGPEVKAFEQAFAAYCRVAHCVGVASGTAALDLVLRSLNVGPGSEVITVAHTFIATAEAISAVGATPVFVDIDPRTYTMDPAGAGRRRHAGDACHPAGPHLRPALRHGRHHGRRPPPRHPRRRRCRPGPRRHLERRARRRAGRCRLFQLLSRQEPRRLRRCRRRDDRQRAICRPGAPAAQPRAPLKIPARDQGLRRAAGHAPGRHSALPSSPTWRSGPPRAAGWPPAIRRCSRTPTWCCPTWRRRPTLPGISTSCARPQRDALLEHLQKHGIGAGVHYPVPLHLQPAYADLGYARGQLPVSEEVADTCLSLPLYPEMTDAQQDRVVATIQEFHRAHMGPDHATRMRQRHSRTGDTISVVVPARNEEATIAAVVERSFAAFAALGRDGEVLVVNDGSTDRTAAILAGTRRPLPAAARLHPPAQPGHDRRPADHVQRQRAATSSSSSRPTWSRTRWWTCRRWSTTSTRRTWTWPPAGARSARTARSWPAASTTP